MKRREILKSLLVAPFAGLFRRRERNYVENPAMAPWAEGSHGAALMARHGAPETTVRIGMLKLMGVAWQTIEETHHEIWSSFSIIDTVLVKRAVTLHVSFNYAELAGGRLTAPLDGITYEPGRDSLSVGRWRGEGWLVDLTIDERGSGRASIWVANTVPTIPGVPVAQATTVFG